MTDALSRHHLRFGWWSLLVFLSLGIALETLHGFKIGWYLDVANEMALSKGLSLCFGWSAARCCC